MVGSEWFWKLNLITNWEMHIEDTFGICYLIDGQKKCTFEVPLWKNPTIHCNWPQRLLWHNGKLWGMSSEAYLLCGLYPMTTFSAIINFFHGIKIASLIIGTSYTLIRKWKKILVYMSVSFIVRRCFLDISVWKKLRLVFSRCFFICLFLNNIMWLWINYFFTQMLCRLQISSMMNIKDGSLLGVCMQEFCVEEWMCGYVLTWKLRMLVA